MPFHVEVSSSFHHARAFNLEQDELQRKIVQPWLEGRQLELGERKWEPGKSTLKILLGPALDSADLAFGQGWSNAERKSENVTRKELEHAPPPNVPDAFVIAAELPEALVAEMLAGREAAPVEWSEARQRIEGRDPSVAAVILVVKDET